MKFIKFYFFLFGAISILTACKKTIDYEPQAQNRIQEFKVVNLQDTVIYGVVNNIENTITVYVPYYYGLSVLQPQIKMDAGAKLGVAIMPVDINKTDQTYTVTGADGSGRTYKLLIVQQNTPDLKINWIDPIAETYPNQSLPQIFGNFLSRGTATLSVKVINRQTKKELSVNSSQASINVNTDDNFPGQYALGGIKTPLEADSGYYDVTINYLGHNVTLPQPVHIRYALPDIAPSYDDNKVAKRGETITFRTSEPGLFIGLSSVSVQVKGSSHVLPVKSYTRLQADLQIPADFPTGSLGRLTFTFNFQGWPPVVTTAPLLINP